MCFILLNIYRDFSSIKISNIKIKHTNSHNSYFICQIRKYCVILDYIFANYLCILFTLNKKNSFILIKN